MNKGLLPVCAFGFFGFLSPAFSSESVQFPTGNAAWTVTITYTATSSNPGAPSPSVAPPQPAASPNALPHPVKADVAVVNDIGFTQISWSNGKVTELWKLVSRKLNVVNFPTNNSIYVIPDNFSQDMRFSKFPLDASGFNWVSPSLLVSEDPVNFQGKMCMHYKSSLSFRALAPITITRRAPTLGTTNAEAWIDKDTLLPVCLDNSGVRYNFTFLPTPTTPLTMPPKFKDELDRYILASTPPQSVGAQR